MTRLLALCGVSLLLLGVSSSPLIRWPSESFQQPSANTFNANHLFNAIHSSMRQFGSSLHHNGMSFFIATVPAGTHFYHGGESKHPVQGPDWLAFEMEHALMFSTQPFIKVPPGKKDIQFTEQQVFNAAGNHREEEARHPGLLRTYAAKHDLRLLYLDGQAAAKSAIGTMDTQDFILVNHTKSKDDDKGSMGEFTRATQMCQRAKEQWKGQIDGIVRMEAGFEILMCSFPDSLKTIRTSTISTDDNLPFNDEDVFFSYYQTVTARYDGIGGNRVRLDYDNFVSAFTFQEADLFHDGIKPRLNATNVKTLHAIRGKVDDMASQSRKTSTTLHDWQSVTDMIIARHAPRLALVTSPAMTSYETLTRQLYIMMRPFIDSSARSQKDEVQRCNDEFIPAGWPTDSTAGQAIRSVSHQICSTISDLLQSETETLATSTKQLNELKAWLNWTTWKRCTGCKADEVCVVPMWPRGSLSDWEAPSCANKTENFQHRGYWGPLLRF